MNVIAAGLDPTQPDLQLTSAAGDVGQVGSHTNTKGLEERYMKDCKRSFKDKRGV